MEEIYKHEIFDDVAKRIPDLNLFNEKISQLKAIQAKIQMVTTPTDIGWLRVHVNPLKVALE